MEEIDICLVHPNLDENDPLTINHRFDTCSDLGILGEYLSKMMNPEYLVTTDLLSTYDNVGLGLLKSVGMANGFRIKIIDGYVERINKKCIVEQIKLIRPQFLGFTCYHINEDLMGDIASEVIINLPEIICFAGGEHCTYSAETQLAKYSWLKFVVCGEGENTLYEALRNIREGKSLNRVDGIIWRDDQGSIIKNPARAVIPEITTIPWPARDSVAESIRKNKKITLGVSTLRGCYGHCSFCNAHSFFSGQVDRRLVRRRCAEDVVKEIAYLKQRYFKLGVAEQIFFYDAHFFYNTTKDKEWLHEFIRLMKMQALYFPFRIYLRADSFCENDIGLIEGLKSCGLQEVFLGIESGAEDTIKTYRKNVRLDKVKRSIDILKKLYVLGGTQGVVFFQPYCTIDSIRKSAKVLRDLGLAMYWNYSQKLRLFPGIKIIDDLKKDGLLLNKSDSQDVYYYRFIDRKVEKVFQLLFANHEPFVVKEGEVVRNIISNMNTLMRGLEKVDLSGHTRSLINQYAAEVESSLESLYDLNLSYFLSIVDLVKIKGISLHRDSSIFKDVKGSYVQRVNERIDRAGWEYRKFIERSLRCLKVM